MAHETHTDLNAGPYYRPYRSTCTCLRHTRKLSGIISACLLLTLAAGTSRGFAQQRGLPSDVPPWTFFRPVPLNPVELAFTYHHASTYAEGAQRGWAAVIQAWGNYELHVAQARLLDEQRRWVTYANDIKQTETLHQRQAMWEENRYAKRRRREARTVEGRRKIQQKAMTTYRKAYRPSPGVLDVETGRIAWPEVLQASKFDSHRQRIEQLFGEHVGYLAAATDLQDEIWRVTKDLERLLRKDIGQLPWDEYATAQKLLRGIRYEAKNLAKVG